MGVDVHGGADVAVAQPFLDQLGVDAVFQQQGRAAVADVVELDLPQAMLFQHLPEGLRHHVRLVEIPHLIHEDVAQEIPVVAVAADLPVFRLLPLHPQQALPDVAHQRQGPDAGTVLRPVRLDQRGLAVHLHLGHHMADGDNVAFKVDVVPHQADDLAAPQAVERGHLEQQRQLVILGQLQEPLHFLGGIVLGNGGGFLGALHPVGGIAGDQIQLHGIF